MEQFKVRPLGNVVHQHRAITRIFTQYAMGRQATEAMAKLRVLRLCVGNQFLRPLLRPNYLKLKWSRLGPLGGQHRRDRTAPANRHPQPRPSMRGRIDHPHVLLRPSHV